MKKSVKEFAFVALGLVLGALYAHSSAAATLPGASPGEAVVTPDGTAHYQIPISIPPGTNGLVPNLAIVYDSARGNGLAGVGGDVSGLSSISRCPRTAATDGSHAPVDFSDQDALCLDGSRLVLFSGTHMASGAQYRGELETFSKITAHGAAGTGPLWFEVRRKDGRILEYGGSGNSRLEGPNGTDVAVWKVSYESDRFGNYMRYAYTPEAGTSRIARIDYTGNDSASVAAYASVRFEYEARTDVEYRYFAGQKREQPKRLANIKTYEGAAVVRNYRLAYDTLGAGGRSRLTSVTECSGNGDCLAATTLAWDSDGTQPDTGQGRIVQRPTFDYQIEILGDFNGDGRTDLLAKATIPNHPTYLYFADTNGLLKRDTTFAPNNWHEFSIYVGDWNGDGMDDIVLNKEGWVHPSGVPNWRPWNFVGATTYFYLGDGTSLTANSFRPKWGGLYNLRPGDFNGDGCDDLFLKISPYAQNPAAGSFLYLAQPDGTYTYSGYTTPHEWWRHQVRVADFTGDGKDDLLVYNQGFGQTNVPGRIDILRSDGTHFYSTGLTAPAASAFAPRLPLPPVADFNGDGLADMLLGSTLHISTGTAFATMPATGLATGGVSRVGDWNGDGRADIVFNPTSLAETRFYTFNGEEFSRTAGRIVYGTWGLVVGDWNGDGLSDVLGMPGTGRGAQIHTAGARDLVTSIVDGLGAETRFEYSPLTDSEIYAKATGAVFPLRDVQPAAMRVRKLRRSDGLGGFRDFEFSYAGLRVDADAREGVGFASRTTKDLSRGTEEHTTYRQDYPLVGFTASNEVSATGGNILQSTVNTWEVLEPGQGRFTACLTKAVVTEREVDGSVTKTTTRDQTFDAFSNPITLTLTEAAGGQSFVTKTTTTFVNQTSNWLIGLVDARTVEQRAPGVPTLTRNVDFVPNLTTGALDEEISDPGTAFELKTKYMNRTFFGQPMKTEISGTGIVTRHTNTLYDANGRYVTSQVDGEGLTLTYQYDTKLGVVTRETGPEPSQAIVRTYDALGHLATETGRDGVQSTVTLAPCGPGLACNLAGAAMKVATTRPGAPDGALYLDALGREMSRDSKGFAGTLVVTDTVYDAAGRPSAQSAPYYAGDTRHMGSTAYDARDRPLVVTEADGGTTRFTYRGLVTEQRNALNQLRTETRDARGLLTRVTEPEGGRIDYTYDAAGRLLTMKDAGNATITHTYALNSTLTRTVDPSLGTTDYVHNVLGELTKETNARAQVRTFTYDKSGRQKTRVEPEGTTTWVWDTATNGRGRLASVDGAATGVGDKIVYFYDTAGREYQTNYYGYRVTRTFDAHGRVASLKYPSNFKINYGYNTNGHLATVTDAATGGATLWTALAQDAFGHVTSFTLGNGVTSQRTYDPKTGRPTRFVSGKAPALSDRQDLTYTWDLLGNLAKRQNHRKNYTETLTYDQLNRLTRVAGTGAAPTITATYASNGNLSHRSDVGALTYGAGTAGPHAVTQAGSVTYTYDATGNRLTSSGGFSAAWTSYNKPRRLELPNYERSLLYYGPSRELYREWRLTRRDTSGTVGALYWDLATLVAGLYEYALSGQRDLIRVGGELIAVRHVDLNVVRFEYVLSDHLGSTDVVMDSAGAISREVSFNPWGVRRNADGSASAALAFANEFGDGSVFPEGFTGQRDLTQLGLVHMGGRVYDPGTGRMLSPDPFIQFPTSTQGMNRYTYVNNNPLSLTDPSGYFIDGFLSTGLFDSFVGGLDLNLGFEPFSGVNPSTYGGFNNFDSFGNVDAFTADFGNYGFGRTRQSYDFQGLSILGEATDLSRYRVELPASFDLSPAELLRPHNPSPADFVAMAREFGVRVAFDNYVSGGHAFAEDRGFQGASPFELVGGAASATRTLIAIRGGRHLPAVYDPDFAARQILGRPTNVTPGGRTITDHAARQMVNPPKGRVPMSVGEVDNVLDTATRVRKLNPHPQGTTVTVQRPDLPGRPQVVIDAETGGRVVTVIRNR